MASCEDCIHNEVCIYKNHETYKTVQDLKNDCPECVPTADVAPKTEVAREILAEIEKNMVVFGDATLSTYFRGIGWKVFAELKKKYTEGNDER